MLPHSAVLRRMTRIMHLCSVISTIANHIPNAQGDATSPILRRLSQPIQDFGASKPIASAESKKEVESFVDISLESAINPQGSSTQNTGQTCMQVSVERFATYCIEGPICIGPKEAQGGKNCPKKGTVAVADCVGDDKQCILPADAQCEVIKTGVWGCTIAMTTTEVPIKPEVAGDADSKTPSAPCPLPQPESGPCPLPQPGSAPCPLPQPELTPTPPEGPSPTLPLPPTGSSTPPPTPSLPVNPEPPEYEEGEPPFESTPVVTNPDGVFEPRPLQPETIDPPPIVDQPPPPPPPIVPELPQPLPPVPQTPSAPCPQLPNWSTPPASPCPELPKPPMSQGSQQESTPIPGQGPSTNSPCPTLPIPEKALPTPCPELPKAPCPLPGWNDKGKENAPCPLPGWNENGKEKAPCPLPGWNENGKEKEELPQVNEPEEAFSNDEKKVLSPESAKPPVSDVTKQEDSEHVSVKTKQSGSRRLASSFIGTTAAIVLVAVLSLAWQI
uniref:Mucinlike protein putative n=1 Tax=Albugo laibachii Nc14 TaxID=890382 RepID=F0WBR3_9STRA|nr:mucinlike protein putative [Albugo laibachii Nc14]CCA20547.1 mucinlike protein putative [Albugo laibachii Nc14]|eukprot:CCA20547.1 mucinlike protein putative [Albugo laibachii Nc14]